MNKQEFERRMDDSKEYFLRNRGSALGVCDLVGCLVSPGASVDFEVYFKPPLSCLYWLGDHSNSDNMTQIERRLVFLESFRGFCEAYELWREW